MEKQQLMDTFDLIVIGGGAAGFFAALNFAEFNPKAKVLILEKSSAPLGKVKISGGGRCNVTHNCFQPSLLIKNYPRGGKNLLENFKTFGPEQTINWFNQKGVKIKAEPDGRMFPTTDSSQTIIDCFLQEAKKMGIQLICNSSANNFHFQSDLWHVETKNENFRSKKLLIATGSSNIIWNKLAQMEYNIAQPVPSLFTFNCKHFLLEGLMGLSVEPVSLQITGSKLNSIGPLLITHWGISGPATLKRSAFAAVELATCDYKFTLKVNWLPNEKPKHIEQVLLQSISENPDKIWDNVKPFNLPSRLWTKIIAFANLTGVKLKASNNKNLVRLVNILTASIFEVNGKSTFKEEFVTCGGVELSEINLETLESKKHKDLYFVGEVLNIDAVTGGFNFQAAWTNAYVFAKNTKL